MIAVAALLFALKRVGVVVLRLKGWTYLGEGRLQAIFFQMIFCGFIALGCMLEIRAVLDFSDAMTFLIALPNILMLYLFTDGQADVSEYIAAIKAR